MYIVITENGFMTTKKKEEIIKSDEVTCYCHSEMECSNIIHGKEKWNHDKIYKCPTVVIDNK
jgi:hypothetical protein